MIDKEKSTMKNLIKLFNCKYNISITGHRRVVHTALRNEMYDVAIDGPFC